ncbi:Osmolarity sensor protein EnvZ [Hartmannibacter diazotrophicus]|uniref:histidine kinase n=1 Tax=Hartmannibacter diazotrophicus TaxID=1482074 RepID=A0A2C9D1F4_9HYPH|nr:ATP-binding protein [Hartmannibacter diazotrophicus]SON54080.1 Osmolarity sensor protein EnvZ [Hartmannibacter diazotrophicus]
MARFRPTLFPRSLAGQLIALLLGAVVLGQALTTVLLIDERRSAVAAANREQILLRTASLVHLLEETPPEMHERILAAASSGNLAFTLSPEPKVTQQPQNHAERRVTQALRTMLGSNLDIRADVDIDRPILYRLSRLMDPPRPRMEQNGEQGERLSPQGEDGQHGDKERPHRPRPIVAFTAGYSLPLQSGGWLNVFAQFGPPPAWAWPTFLSGGLIALGIIGIVVVMVRRITRPLRALSVAADKLGRGDTSGELPETGPVEIRQTTRAFNAMQERLGRFVADRTRLLAAISHDLRTPLTALRLRAEFVEDDEIREKLIETIDEMHRMTEATLAFAREDVSHEPARRVDLAALVSALGDDFADMGENVTVTAPDRLDLTVRPTALRRAIRNLIENALRYGGSAHITMEVGEDIVIAIEDEGPGIPNGHMEEVFEPFVRLETSRSQETGGVGLGLATARSIAHAHGGEIRLSNRPKGGLRAAIHLPKPAA